MKRPMPGEAAGPVAATAAQDAQARRREAVRQQLMLRSLWRDNTVAAVQGWLSEAPPRVLRGLNAYASAGGANAERALAQACPTVQALMGEASFALLARAYRLAHPPRRGDLAWLGEHLPGFIAADPQLADVPYLADCARLDLLLAHAERAADAAPELHTLALLQQADPAEVVLLLAPGTALLRSAWPVATIHAAHAEQAQPGYIEHVQTDAAASTTTMPAEAAGADRFAAARQALADGHGECAWVWRRGLKPSVAAVAPAQASLGQALLGGATLGAALERADAGLDFEAWLLDALRLGWLLGARLAMPAHGTSHKGNAT